MNNGQWNNGKIRKKNRDRHGDSGIDYHHIGMQHLWVGQLGPSLAICFPYREANLEEILSMQAFEIIHFTK